MNIVDMQLRFLEGKPIEIKNNVHINKVSYSDINDIGFIRYNRIINTLCIDKYKITQIMKDENIDAFTFILLSATHLQEDDSDYSFMEELLLVLQYICNDVVLYDDEFEMFLIGDYGVIERSNFEEFQTVLKKRNCLESIEEDMENPDNSMAKALLEKRKKARERLAKAKTNQSDNDDSLTIMDLISIFAESEHMFIEDVFKYDTYQFNDQFNRMKIFKDYQVNIQALLAGAKNEEIDLQHWLSKIKTE